MYTLFQRPDKIDEPLHVVMTVFNSPRWRSRYKLFEDALKRIKGRVIPYVAEVAFGERDFVVKPTDNLPEKNILKLRTHHELFLKENTQNLMVQRLPPSWKYVALLDGDLTFVEDDWHDEVIHALQHNPIIQCYSQALPLGPNGEPIGKPRLSISYNYLNQGNSLFKENYSYGAKGWGLAWAYRREAWDGLGGMIDWSILGGGDWFMGHALWGNITKAIQRRKYHPRYSQLMYEWQNRAKNTYWQERPLLGNVGVIKGLVLHHWHGPTEGRQYKTRPQTLVKHHFNPDVDLKRDWQGLYQLTSNKPELRRDIQRYFRTRNEDSVDLDKESVN